MKFRSQTETVEVDVYCEHLLSIRRRDPEAFRLMRKTAQAALAAYEEAKRKAESLEKVARRSEPQNQ